MSQEKPLWEPSAEQIKNANITRYIQFLSQNQWITPDQGQLFHKDFHQLYQWSITSPVHFWMSIVKFCDVIGDFPLPYSVEDFDYIEKAKFFPNATLNFAENLLRRRDDATALWFFSEKSDSERVISFKELYESTCRLAKQLKEWGVQPHDRVAAYVPNIPETVISALATTSIGAIFSSCSQDFGVSGVVDRFSQIEPKVLIAADGYWYNGKPYCALEKIEEIKKQIPSIEHVILIPYLSKDVNHENRFDEVLKRTPFEDLEFEKFPFNHPLYILYSSGTTGVPKSIIHRAGGVLLQHLKEHQLHGDIKKDDKVFYFTTCGWMMWNWLVTVLASQATAILYDGSPFPPDSDSMTLFKIAEKTKMTFFGTSAKYIDMLMKLNLKPKDHYDLSHLRVIGSTGSPLSQEGFDHVYSSIKKDVCLSSLSGGTDIVSCFVLGCPVIPVWRGEIQTRGLGMKIEVYDENGKNMPVGEKGELVCTIPFPCQPLGFWKDDHGKKYHKSYFAHYANVWHHGDFAEITKHNGVIIHGRSDTVLNSGGVRIGTAEIYRQVKKISEITECVAVGQEWDHDTRIILFVVVKEGASLTDELIKKIKTQIKNETTPRHVPAKIIAVKDIPRTRNSKISEIAVHHIVNGLSVSNVGSLENPNSLEYFKDLEELKS